MPTHQIPAADAANASHESLWTIEQAAAYLEVSPRYLRDTDCPRVRLPGHGVRRQAVIRYIPSVVRAWVDQWRTDRAPQSEAA